MHVWMNVWMNAACGTGANLDLWSGLLLLQDIKGCGGPGALAQLLAKGTAAVTEGCVCVTNSCTAGPDPLLSPLLVQEKELPMLQPT